MQIQLRIEKLVYGGDGLVRTDADSNGRRLTAFVPGVMPGETVEVRLGRAKSGFARAELLRIISPSAERVQPQCRHFGVCGGCQWQHMSNAAQLAAKQEILLETFTRAGVRELRPVTMLSAEPWRYRNRVRLHVDPRTRSVGYLEARSHRVVAVTDCPIASPLVMRAIAAIQAAPKLLDATKEIELFAAPDDDMLVAAVYTAMAGTAKRWYATLLPHLPELAGVAMLHSETSETLDAAGSPALHIEALQADAGVFFQANRLLLGPLVKAVTEAVPAEPCSVWDLYAGIGLFAAELERRGHYVTAVEGSPLSFADLSRNVRHAQRQDVAQFLAGQAEPPDCIVLDPPRAGLGQEVCAELARLQPKRLVYLACDPVTMARDIAMLDQAGYRMESLTLIDLFPQTFHIETLAVLTRG